MSMMTTALQVAILMAAAVVMHAKVRDPVRKAVPAAVMFVCALLVVLA